MDILFLVLGSVFILLGIVGSFLPILPGPLTSWGGLFFLHLHSSVTSNSNFIWITLGVALLVFLLDYFAPAIGAKKFGGTKNGMYGSIIGLFMGILFMGPFGIIIGPFLGAFAGELLHNSNDRKRALKAAFGTFLGFLSGVFIKLIVTLIYLYFFFAILWKQVL